MHHGTLTKGWFEEWTGKLDWNAHSVDACRRHQTGRKRPVALLSRLAIGIFVIVPFLSASCHTETSDRDDELGIWALAFSENVGGLVVGRGEVSQEGDTKGYIEIRKSDTLKLVSRVKCEEPITSLAVCPKGRVIVAGLNVKNALLMWNPEENVTKEIAQPGEVWSLALSPDGTRLAVGLSAKKDGKGLIRILDFPSCEEVAVIDGHASSVFALSFSADGAVLASGSSDKNIKLWNSKDWSERATLKGHSKGVTCLAFVGESYILISGSHDQMIMVWDARKLEKQFELRGHSGQVHSLAIGKDGKTLASGSYDGTVKLWDLARKKETKTLTGQKGRVEAIIFCEKDRTLAAGGGGETRIRIWDVEKGEERK